MGPVGNKGTKQAFQDMTERYPDASFMINMGDVTETGLPQSMIYFSTRPHCLLRCMQP